MWCAIAMPPYGGFFMAVDPLQKHIFRGAHKFKGIYWLEGKEESQQRNEEHYKQDEKSLSS